MHTLGLSSYFILYLLFNIPPRHPSVWDIATAESMAHTPKQDRSPLPYPIQKQTRALFLSRRTCLGSAASPASTNAVSSPVMVSYPRMWGCGVGYHNGHRILSLSLASHHHICFPIWNYQQLYYQASLCKTSDNTQGSPCRSPARKKAASAYPGTSAARRLGKPSRSARTLPC